MWVEEGRTGLLPGSPATATPTMLAETTVVPRAVLDLGFGVNVQEGTLLVAALPCRETETCVHLGQLCFSQDPPWLLPRPEPAVQQRGPGGSGVQSWAGKPQDSWQTM